MSLNASALVDLWLGKIAIAKERKKSTFQDLADTCAKFYNGPHDFQFSPDMFYKNDLGFSSDYNVSPEQNFRITVNKVFELVRLFLPYLYHRIPKRSVKARNYHFNEQLTQQLQYQDQRGSEKMVAAQLLEWALNYTPNELGLVGESRYAVSEALVKGAGVIWHEMLPTGANRSLPASRSDTIDDLFMDADVLRERDCKWIARRRVAPVWELAKKFGIPSGKIKSNMGASGSGSTGGAYYGDDMAYATASDQGNTNDLVQYYEIYSRMGLGDRLQGAPLALREVLSSFGDHAYLVIAPGTPFPLNLPPALFLEEGTAPDIAARIRWPIAFHADPRDPWPMSILYFHKKHKQLWPVSHIAPALGEQIFLNWAYGMLAGKIHTTSRDFIVVAQSASAELKEAIMNGESLTQIPINDVLEGGIKNVVDFLQHPRMNSDIFQVVAMIEQNFEKRTGLNELMYAVRGNQMRSGTEAQMMRDAMQITPSDMAQEVDLWSAKIARKEAIAMRHIMQKPDVQYMFGEKTQQIQVAGPQGMPQLVEDDGFLTRLWMQVVNNPNIEEVVAEFDYLIEESSGMKNDSEQRANNMNQALQYMGPLAQQIYQATGDPSMLNGLMDRWQSVMEFEDPRFYAPDMRQQAAANNQQQQQQGVPA